MTSARKGIRTYSDAACTVPCDLFAIGATVYIDGDVTVLTATTSTTVKIEVYDSTPTLKSTPLNTTYNFLANTATTIKTNINGGTAPSFSTTGYSAGIHDIKLTISGAGVVTTYSYESVSLSATTAGLDDTITYTTKDAAMVDEHSFFVPGDTMHVYGYGRFSGDVSTVNVKIRLYDLEDVLLATIMDKNYNFAADDKISYLTINGTVFPNMVITNTYEGQFLNVKTTFYKAGVINESFNCFIEVQATQSFANYYEWISGVMSYLDTTFTNDATLSSYATTKVLIGHHEQLKNILSTLTPDTILIHLKDETHSERAFDTQSVEWTATISANVYTRLGNIMEELNDETVQSTYLTIFGRIVDVIEGLRITGNRLGYWEDIMPGGGRPGITKEKNNVINTCKVECKVRYISTTALD